MKHLLSSSTLLLVLFSPISAASSLYPPSNPKRSVNDYIKEGKNGMVVTAHPLASNAGLSMLEKGGNAVDAAIASSFALAVVRPQSTGVGGGGFMLMHRTGDHHPYAFDFRERAPHLATKDMYITPKGDTRILDYQGKAISNPSLNGHLAVGVPGLVAGLVNIHERFGKLPLRTVLQPAIDLAAKGFSVYSELEEAIKERKELLEIYPGSREIYFSSGTPLKTGDLLVQKDLSWSLQEIAETGTKSFYTGKIADLLLKEMKGGGGILDKKDLDFYRMIERQPLAGEFEGYKIYSMPPPSSGGVHILQVLKMLGQENFKTLKQDSPEYIHLLTESLRRVFHDRALYLGDADLIDVPLKGLLNPVYLTKKRASIDLYHATPSLSLKKGNPEFYGKEHPSTTHLSVVDKDGNAVSSTQTINYTFGSCVTAQGTGIMLNNEMDDFSIKPHLPNIFGLVGNEANEISPGKTMLSSMSPTIVFDARNKPYLIVGSPGGPRIITATLETMLNVLAFHLPLPQAVHQLRIHHQWLPDELIVEAGLLSESTKKKLASMGHMIRVAQNHIGDVQAIMREGDKWVGVSDSRSTGMPAGY